MKGREKLNLRISIRQQWVEAWAAKRWKTKWKEKFLLYLPVVSLTTGSSSRRHGEKSRQLGFLRVPAPSNLNCVGPKNKKKTSNGKCNRDIVPVNIPTIGTKFGWSYYTDLVSMWISRWYAYLPHQNWSRRPHEEHAPGWTDNVNRDNHAGRKERCENSAGLTTVEYKNCGVGILNAVTMIWWMAP